MVIQLTEVADILEAKFVTIGREAKGITVGKVYDLLYGQAIGFDPNFTIHNEYYFINDDGKPMTLSGVWGLMKSKFFK